METVIDLLKAIQLNMLDAVIAGLFIFLNRLSDRHEKSEETHPRNLRFAAGRPRIK